MDLSLLIDKWWYAHPVNNPRGATIFFGKTGEYKTKFAGSGGTWEIVGDVITIKAGGMPRKIKIILLNEHEFIFEPVVEDGRKKTTYHFLNYKPEKVKLSIT